MGARRVAAVKAYKGQKTTNKKPNRWGYHDPEAEAKLSQFERSVWWGKCSRFTSSLQLDANDDGLHERYVCPCLFNSAIS